jgi:osmotically-inducible protein OsmY
MILRIAGPIRSGRNVILKHGVSPAAGVRKLLAILHHEVNVVESVGHQRPGDAQITTNVESRLNQHPEIGTEVNVQTLNHVVYLSGFVAAGEIRATAENVAGAAPGVSKVVDTIAVTH